jgi:hypothetical protein
MVYLKIIIVGVQDSYGILSANERSPLFSCKEQQHTYHAILSGRSSHWRSGFQSNARQLAPGNSESGNERSLYMKLLAGFQIGILQRAKSVQLKPSFNKQNEKFKKSQDLKGRSEKFKNQ